MVPKLVCWVSSSIWITGFLQILKVRWGPLQTLTMDGLWWWSQERKPQEIHHKTWTRLCRVIMIIYWAPTMQTCCTISHVSPDLTMTFRIDDFTPISLWEFLRQIEVSKFHKGTKSPSERRGIWPQIASYLRFTCSRELCNFPVELEVSGGPWMRGKFNECRFSLWVDDKSKDKDFGTINPGKFIKETLPLAIKPSDRFITKFLVDIYCYSTSI